MSQQAGNSLLYPKFNLDYSALWKVAMRILRVFEGRSWLGLLRLLVTLSFVLGTCFKSKFC